MLLERTLHKDIDEWIGQVTFFKSRDIRREIGELQCEGELPMDDELGMLSLIEHLTSTGHVHNDIITELLEEIQIELFFHGIGIDINLEDNILIWKNHL